MNIRKLDIRTLTASLFQQIVTIEENCGLDPYTPEMLLDCIGNLDTYACMDSGKIAGFITINPASRKMGGGVYIVNLNVAADYRRQGIGSKLILNACEAYKRTHSGRLVTLDVARDNIAAMRLYKKLGFTITDIPSGNGDTDVVMCVSLDQLYKENL